MYIDKKFLKANPNYIFVFGDNQLRIGYGGAASLRDEPNTYGFITKKEPNMNDNSFYRPNTEYQLIFQEELSKLINTIQNNPDKIFLISKLGGGLANKYGIREQIIEPGISLLTQFSNVKFI